MSGSTKKKGSCGWIRPSRSKRCKNRISKRMQLTFVPVSQILSADSVSTKSRPHGFTSPADSAREAERKPTKRDRGSHDVASGLHHFVIETLPSLSIPHRSGDIQEPSRSHDFTEQERPRKKRRSSRTHKPDKSAVPSAPDRSETPPERRAPRTEAVKRGFTLGDSRHSGFTLGDSRRSGFTLGDPRRSGITLGDPRRSGFTVSNQKRPDGRPQTVLREPKKVLVYRSDDDDDDEDDEDDNRRRERTCFARDFRDAATLVPRSAPPSVEMGAPSSDVASRPSMSDLLSITLSEDASDLLEPMPFMHREVPAEPTRQTATQSRDRMSEGLSVSGPTLVSPGRPHGNFFVPAKESLPERTTNKVDVDRPPDAARSELHGRIVTPSDAAIPARHFPTMRRSVHSLIVNETFAPWHYPPRDDERTPSPSVSPNVCSVAPCSEHDPAAIRNSSPSVAAPSDATCRLFESEYVLNLILLAVPFGEPFSDEPSICGWRTDRFMEDVGRSGVLPACRWQRAPSGSSFVFPEDAQPTPFASCLSRRNSGYWGAVMLVCKDLHRVARDAYCSTPEAHFSALGLLARGRETALRSLLEHPAFDPSFLLQLAPSFCSWFGFDRNATGPTDPCFLALTMLRDHLLRDRPHGRRIYATTSFRDALHRLRSTATCLQPDGSPSDDETAWLLALLALIHGLLDLPSSRLDGEDRDALWQATHPSRPTNRLAHCLVAAVGEGSMPVGACAGLSADVEEVVCFCFTLVREAGRTGKSIRPSSLDVASEDSVPFRYVLRWVCSVQDGPAASGCAHPSDT